MFTKYLWCKDQTLIQIERKSLWKISIEISCTIKRQVDEAWRCIREEVYWPYSYRSHCSRIQLGESYHRAAVLCGGALQHAEVTTRSSQRKRLASRITTQSRTTHNSTSHYDAQQHVALRRTAARRNNTTAVQVIKDNTAEAMHKTQCTATSSIAVHQSTTGAIQQRASLATEK